MKAIGIDLIELERIGNAISRFGSVFLKKILTHNECEEARLHKNPVGFVAGRFAAKEAVAKALQTGFGKHLAFHDIEISNNHDGAPRVKLSKKAQEHFNNPSFHISISHAKSMATAVAACY